MKGTQTSAASVKATVVNFCVRVAFSFSVSTAISSSDNRP